MASPEIEREIEDFANNQNMKLHRRRPLSERRQLMKYSHYMDETWKNVLKELKEQEAIDCFL